MRRKRPEEEVMVVVVEWLKVHIEMDFEEEGKTI